MPDTINEARPTCAVPRLLAFAPRPERPLVARLRRRLERLPDARLQMLDILLTELAKRDVGE